MEDAKKWVFHLSERAIINNFQITWRQPRPRSIILVAWSFLQPKYFKLNIDDASIQDPGLTCGDGVIRDSNDAFIAIFSKPFGYASNNYAEFQALEVGIHLTIQANYFPLQIESDSSLLVNAIHDRC
ncbi:hypothetical protein AMTRI_Chr11g156690 [Amborella trichopoda]